MLMQCWTNSNLPGDLRNIIQWLPAVIYWGIWCVRAVTIFEGVTPHSAQVLHQVISIFQSATQLKPLKLSSSYSIRLAQQLQFHFSWVSKLAISLTWIMPAVGCVKLNMDGAFLGNPGHSGRGMGYVILRVIFYLLSHTILMWELVSKLKCWL